MAATKQIPKEAGIDSTFALLKEGYLYIPRRLEKFNSFIFETRLMGKRAIVISGKEAAELFYDEKRMQRSKAVPKRIQKSLFGVGGVQGLDDEMHRHRKQLFLSLLTRENIGQLLTLFEKQLDIAADEWVKMEAVPFFQEIEKLLFRTVCSWSGIPLWARELKQRAKDMGAMVDAFGAVGVRYNQGRKARKRSEVWIQSIIEQVRAGRLFPDEETPLYQIAWYKDLNGALLPSRTAAVELINILRPTVAVGRFITFGLVAFVEHSEARKKFALNEGNYRQMFVQEVQRYYPFAPFLGARTRLNFKWKDYPFKKGTLVILDIYGTNRSPEIWHQPDEFLPERFGNWDESPFSFIPQGGGNDGFGHRCAGEGLTVALMKTCLGFIADQLTYSLPPQDLSYKMNRMPTIPESRVVLAQIRRKKE